MADYNLHGLNPRDFQHLVQAIARQEISSGLVALGDGKDGARDMTINGPTRYPNQEAAWNGYLIVGCKFHQKQVDSAAANTWVLSQLEKELKKFVRKPKNKRPEYYLFVTNLALTPVEDVGGRDKVKNLYATYKDKLGLKGCGLWDYHDLRGFLDAHSSIRQAYGHLITAGDVLEEVLKFLKVQKKSFSTALHRFVQKEFLSDCIAKLQSAGDDPESRISLASVFIDLPFTFSSEEALLGAPPHRGEQLENVVQTLLEAGAGVLSRKSQDKDVSITRSSRYAIVGGPGQGKSTFGQYLCQLYRAALLKDYPRDQLETRVRDAIKELSVQAQQIGNLPVARRFPIRVELRLFSQALSTNPKLTLTEYIRADIERLSSSSLTIDDLTSWLSEFPTLLVLDGLDEVPPSSNRSEVMREVNALLIDLVSGNSDSLIVATTRPQSYSDEFKDLDFRHLYLTPLSSKQALEYGTKLAHARCGDDQHRRIELVKSLEKACSNPETSRLMQSPLQVTIMATLLEDTGEPPQQRYRLFYEYFRTIYKRETRRKLLNGVLSERQTDIEVIHAQAGFLMHAKGEGAAEEHYETATDMSDAQFRVVVQRRLTKQGLAAERATELSDRISDGTLQRLVFLVRPRVGHVQFDIASFREYMAAVELMNGPDETVRDRLNCIGWASYWRNVLLFAVGKCFNEREYLLDSFMTMCSCMNHHGYYKEYGVSDISSRAAESALWGSRLALDVLFDGSAKQFPILETDLTEKALLLVNLGDSAMCFKLASVYHEDQRELYQRTVNQVLSQIRIFQQLGAWYLLLGLAERGVVWAITRLDEVWPDSVDDRQTLFKRTLHLENSKWIATKRDEHSNELHPRYFERLRFRGSRVARRPGGTTHEALNLLYSAKRLIAENNSSLHDVFYRTSLIKCDAPSDVNKMLGKLRLTNRWQPLISVFRFWSNPCASTLANELEELARVWFLEDPWRPETPWPMASCLSMASSPEDLVKIAGKVALKEFGDIGDWREAERRWSRDGVTDVDIAACANGVELNSSIAHQGYPFSCSVFRDDNSDGVHSNTGLILAQIQSVNDSRLRGVFAARAIGNVLADDEPVEFTVENLQILLGMANDSLIDGLYIGSDQPPTGTKEAKRKLFESLSKYELWIDEERASANWYRAVYELFLEDTSSGMVLLPLLQQIASTGYYTPIPDTILDSALHSSDRIASSALLLLLASRTIDEERILDILARIQDSKIPVYQVTAMGGLHSHEREVELAYHLFTKAKRGFEEERALGLNSMVRYLQNLPSALLDQQRWAQLKLPEKV